MRGANTSCTYLSHIHRQESRLHFTLRAWSTSLKTGAANPMFGLDFCPWRRFLCIPILLSGVVGTPLAAPTSPSDQRRSPPPGEAFVHDLEFNAGNYGRYVTQTFKSSNITATRINMMQPFTECDDGSYIFISPRGEDVDRPSASIYDPRYFKACPDDGQ